MNPVAPLNRSDGPEAGAPENDAIPRARVLVFEAGGSRYAIPIDAVREVLHTPPITWIPFAAAAVAGVVSVRGEVMAVLDLGLALGETAAARPGRLIVVDDRTIGEAVGLLAEDVSGIEAVATLDATSPEIDESLPAGVFAGAGGDEQGRVVTLLHLEPVLAIGRTDDAAEGR